MLHLIAKRMFIKSFQNDLKNYNFFAKLKRSQHSAPKRLNCLTFTKSRVACSLQNSLISFFFKFSKRKLPYNYDPAHLVSSAPLCFSLLLQQNSGQPFFEAIGGMDNMNTTIVSLAYDDVSDYIYGCGYSFSNNGFLSFDNTTTNARPFIIKMPWDLSSIQWVKWYQTPYISPQTASFQFCYLNDDRSQLVIYSQMYQSAFIYGQDAVHVVDTATGYHNNSWLLSQCINCMPNFTFISYYGGTAQMYKSQIFVIFGEYNMINAMTIDNTQGDNQVPKEIIQFTDASTQLLQVHSSQLAYFDNSKVYVGGGTSYGLFIARWAFNETSMGWIFDWITFYEFNVGTTNSEGFGFSFQIALSYDSVTSNCYILDAATIGNFGVQVLFGLFVHQSYSAKIKSQTPSIYRSLTL